MCIMEASEKIPSSVILSSLGLCDRTAMRAFSISPLPLVVKLKTIEPDTPAHVMMKKTRAMILGGRSTTLVLRLPRASPSFGPAGATTTPQTTPIPPPRTYPHSHPNHLPHTPNTL